MEKSTFLVEIGTEELPFKILKKLGIDFAHQISVEFQKNDIYCTELVWFVSLRHLAVKLKVQLDDMYRFLNTNYYRDKCDVRSISLMRNNTNLDRNQNEIINGMEQKRCICIEDLGNNVGIQNFLFNIVKVVLLQLMNYEMMRWGEVDTPFVRPVHTITVLLDSYLIRGCIFGVNIDRVLCGHPCMLSNEIVITHADEYPDILYKHGQVIVDYDIRKEIICLGAKEEAEKIGGVILFEEDNLLDEITSLVEWPVVLSGKFDKKFLNLPIEVILHIMRHDLKYFPIYDAISGILLPYFIFVINIITKNYDKIIAGYESIIKPRLMDAEFFLHKDKKYRLEDYNFKLSTMLFHSKLGTLYEKSYRISVLSGWIASKVGADVKQTNRAGYLCKCDLMSSMVFEFPVAQGVIGMYYALRDGESEEVALAQKEHYFPRFATDILPTTEISCSVAVADKMDTISGIFGIQELPKGNRDPFSLKRFAFGILRILIQKKLSLHLSDLIKESVKLYGSRLTNMTVIDDIRSFMYKRLYSWYYMQNFKADIIKAVLSIDCFDLLSVDARMHAVNLFYCLKKEENIKLCVIYKRILNIVLSRENTFFLCDNVYKFLLKFPEEKELADRVFFVEKELERLLQNSLYYESLVLLTTLFVPINNFFDHVIVMDLDITIRKNRFILLHKIKNLFLRIMDFSLLRV